MEKTACFAAPTASVFCCSSPPRGVAAAEVSPALLELNKAAFFHGREYFVLRSGRAQMVVQADRADLGPAFTWLLFDAQDAKQSARKESAFNFVPKEGFGSSALEVVLGGFPFTALGHRTDTRWVVEEGIPAVEAVWWAGGVRVTERISALAAEGAFRRTVQLEGAHLVGRGICAAAFAPAAERSAARKAICCCKRETGHGWLWPWRTRRR